MGLVRSESIPENFNMGLEVKEGKNSEVLMTPGCPGCAVGQTGMKALVTPSTSYQPSLPLLKLY